MNRLRTCALLGALLLTVGGCSSNGSEDSANNVTHFNLRFEQQPVGRHANTPFNPNVSVAIIESATGAVIRSATNSVNLSAVRIGQGPTGYGGMTPANAVSGIATIDSFSVTTSGTYYLVATCGDVTTRSRTFVMSSGPPARLYWVNPPKTNPANSKTPNNRVGQPLTSFAWNTGAQIAPQVVVQDAQQQWVTTGTYTIKITLEANPTNARLAPGCQTTYLTHGDGIANLENVRIDLDQAPSPSQTYRLKAEIPGLGISAVSEPFALNPAK